MTGDEFAAAVGLIGKNRRKTVRAWEAGERKPLHETGDSPGQSCHMGTLSTIDNICVTFGLQ